MLGVCLKYEQSNYGSKLQALATVKMFEKLGVDYEIIRYNKRTLSFYLKSLPRFFNKTFIDDRYYQLQRAINYKRNPSVKANVDIRNEAFRSFDGNFRDHLSVFYSSYEELKGLCGDKYDKVITCSDQLWSPAALGSGFYNLMFVPDEVKKISWASSFGVHDIPRAQRKRTKEYLEHIESISMRENRGAEIVKELTGRDVPVLMDPVFAFNKEEWNELVPLSAPEWDDYIFCYFLGDNPEHREAAKRLSEQTGKKIVTLRHLDKYVEGDESFGDITPYDVDPVRFLNILRNAAYVCTDSFHGTAFSVIFEKKFVVFDRYSNSSSVSRNSRIDTVCDNLGLRERRGVGVDDIGTICPREIDYSSVKLKLDSYKAEIEKYLRANLL